jgi:hypothetical protein
MYSKNQQELRVSTQQALNYSTYWRTVTKEPMQLGINPRARTETSCRIIKGTMAQHICAGTTPHFLATIRIAGESPARFRSGPKALSEPGRHGTDVQRQHLWGRRENSTHTCHTCLVHSFKIVKHIWLFASDPHRHMRGLKSHFKLRHELSSYFLKKIEFVLDILSQLFLSG